MERWTISGLAVEWAFERLYYRVTLAGRLALLRRPKLNADDHCSVAIELGLNPWYVRTYTTPHFAGR